MLQLQQIPSYTDPVFETYFENLERDQFSVIGIQAKQDGLANKPFSFHHHKIQVIEPIKSVFQKALEFNYSGHQPISDLAIGQKQRTGIAEIISIKEKERNAKKKSTTSLPRIK